MALKAELSRVAYEIVKDGIDNIVHTRFGNGNLALLGGIIRRLHCAPCPPIWDEMCVHILKLKICLRTIVDICEIRGEWRN